MKRLFLTAALAATLSGGLADAQTPAPVIDGAAFDIRPGDALYLPPEQRVRIW